MKRLPVPERFATNIEFTDTCWLWLGFIETKGYGRFHVPERKSSWRVHRWAYEFCVGPIPDGLTIDHLCRVRHCVNPDHLEPVTIQENIRRGDHNGGRPKGSRNRHGPSNGITHCLHGHLYDEANTIINLRGHRECRQCRTAQWARRRKAVA